VSEDLLKVLMQYHREVVIPDMTEIVESRIAPFREETPGSLDGLYHRFDRLDSEVQAIKAGMTRLEERILAVELRLQAVERRLISVEAKLEAVALRDELTELKDRIAVVEHRLEELQSRS
jgi:predicted  nucleic acid-binding Zn-ribbon protein